VKEDANARSFEIQTLNTRPSRTGGAVSIRTAVFGFALEGE
jgi:hypothetical protein